MATFDAVLPVPEPDAAMELPVEELGLRLLSKIPAPGGRAAAFGRLNYIGLEKSKHWEGYGGTAPRVNHRIWEQHLSAAFDWLVAEGLVVRDVSQRGDNWLVLSDRGQRTLHAPDERRYHNAQKALALELHPSIDARVRRQLAIGEVEQAVSIAVKQVEIAVREAAGLGNDAIGKKMMAQVFRPGEGELHDDAIEPSEQEGFMYLFMGLIAALKNPTSHRQVDYDDLTDAVEVIQFADLLLRVVDRARGRKRPTGSHAQ